MNKREFERFVRRECKRVLKPDLDYIYYSNAILSELWDGTGYGEAKYEIRQFHTTNGRPYVISWY